MTTTPDRDNLSVFDTILTPGFENAPTWRKEELTAILEHQWITQVAADMECLSAEQAHILTRLDEAAGTPMTYGDIFTCSAPSIAVLEMIKVEAKRNMARANEELPEDIAKLLYILSVIVARLRCGVSITSQPDKSVRGNIESALAQSWPTPPIIQILRDGLKVFGEGQDSSREQ